MSELALTPEDRFRPQLQMMWPAHRLQSPPPVRVPAAYRLRTHRPGDEPAFCRLMEKVGWPGWNESNLQPWLARIPPESWFILIDEASGQLAATAMGLQDHSSLHPFGSELGWVAADPEHAGQGLGGVVCAAVTARLINAGYRDIHLFTEDWRLPALKTYFKLGFVSFLFTDEMPARWRAICTQLQWPFMPDSWQQAGPAPQCRPNAVGRASAASQAST